ncbi:MAG: serine hydrolase [Bacteroidetes bacterium]|nr:serine hydrolase [Bacteroidota bacterium]
MIKFTPILILSALLFSCGTKKSEHTAEFINTQKELTQKLTEISKQTDFNGFGVALANDREVLYQNGFGIANVETKQPYTEQTVQNIASVSKTFIGLALLKAQESGKLKLDDPINKYLPFKVFNPAFPDIPITIRQLATHTSSIIDGNAYMTNAIVLKDTINLDNNLKIDISPTHFNPPSAKISIEAFLNNILDTRGKWFAKDAFSEYKPGEKYAYSNVGATLAALVIEKATGISYDKYTTQFILEPLKMTASGWSFATIDFSKYTRTYQDSMTPYPYYSLNSYPDGGMLTTPTDMGKYICELLKGYVGKGTLLTKESYKEYFTPQLKADQFIDRDTSIYTDEYNMGITIGFGATMNFGHYGGDPGLNSMIYFNKETKTGKYYIINTNPSGPVTGKNQKLIMDLLDEYAVKLDSLSKLN